MRKAARVITLLRRVRDGTMSRWWNLYFRAAGVRMHGYIWIRRIEIPRDFHNIEITDSSFDQVVLLCSGPPSDKIKLRFDRGVYVNRRTFFDVIEWLTVGEETAIGPGCYLTDHDHGPDLSVAPLQQPMVSKPTHIGKYVWLGANVVVLKGVTIGDRTIVGAGSVVTKSLPPDVIAAGVPARVIRSRLPGEHPTGGFNKIDSLPGNAAR
jgi:acetyltransferase-like isoleucine patch superfamily enzyme